MTAESAQAKFRIPRGFRLRKLVEEFFKLRKGWREYRDGSRGPLYRPLPQPPLHDPKK